MVSIQILRRDFLIAEVYYNPGFLVEINVEESFRNQKIDLQTGYHHRKLSGYWQEALDEYFNDWIFESKAEMFPDDLTRSGCARDHKNLFLTAARALEKDLTPFGY